MNYTSLPAAFFLLLLLLGNISVVYSDGYVSDACSELCSEDGLRGDNPLLPADATPGFNGKFRELILAYDTGSTVDLDAKVKYGNDINCWDVSKLTDFSAVFEKTNFNSRLDCWDTSGVTSMTNMLKQASAFNQDINDWDTSRVTNMFRMFRDAPAFNQEINGWDTSNAEILQEMFLSSKVFNQDISDWDTSNAVNMANMFQGAEKFDQDIGMWDVSSVTTTKQMFRYAKAFNQNLCDWNLLLGTESSVGMFDQSGCEVKEITSGNAVCQTCPKLLSLWQLEAVGQDSSNGKPSSTVELSDGDKPFTVTTYFEATENILKNIPQAEVFYNVAANEDDCSKGERLVDEGTFVRTISVDTTADEYTEKFKDVPGKAFPQYDNGIVRKVIVTLSDPLYGPIFTADNVNNDIDGTVDFCVRISYVTPIGRVASYFDSKKKITLSLTANVASFNEVVNIEKVGSTKLFEADVVKEVDVESFVCTNQNNKIKDGRLYRVGQDFRICVGPTQAGIDAGYVVDGFNKLVCGGIDLVTQKDETDVLTFIDEKTKNGSLGVRSVLTPDFASGDSVNCRGAVSLSYTTPGSNRRYLAPSSIEVEESLEGLFNMNVNMNSPSIESSASPLTSVAMIGFGSILSFVVSLLM